MKQSGVRWWTLGLVTLLAGMGLSACGSSSQTVTGEAEILRVQRRLWATRSVNSYRYRLQYLAFAPRDLTVPVVIEVRNGTPVSITPDDPEVTVDPNFFSRVDTVEELFDEIERVIETDPATITVEYAPDFGYPQRLSVDQIEMAVDDEFTYTITDFEFLL